MIYENTYLDLRINFPATWNVVSWKNVTIKRNWRQLYQIRDDDLPRGGHQNSKFLCRAELTSVESDAMVDADIEISVFRLAPGEELRSTLPENLRREDDYFRGNGIDRTLTGEGALTIKGIEFGFVDEESISRGKESRYRFIFRRIDEAFWLYIKIAGHKEEAFDEALNVINGMDWRGAGANPNST